MSVRPDVWTLSVYVRVSPQTKLDLEVTLSNMS
jgi:hypothetical protein